MRLFLAIRALEEHNGIRAEFVDDLPASPTGRAGHAMIIDDGDGADFYFWSEFRDRGKDGCALGTIRHAVGSVFHVASREQFAGCRSRAAPTRKRE